MNKFFGIPPGSLLNELNYLKKLGFDKNKENDIWDKLCLHNDSDKEKTKARKKFSSHPKRLASDTSMGSSRRTSISSKGSSPKLEPKKGSDVFQEKIIVQDVRKDHGRSQQLQCPGSDLYRFELGIGDNSSITPPKDEESVKMITFFDNAQNFQQGGRCRKKGALKTTSKSLPSHLQHFHRKTPPMHGAQRGVVSDSMFEKKFRMVTEKCLNVTTDIRSLLEDGVIPPDGEEDESRRLVRVKEFCNRFSRNYLYPLARQLEELTAMAPSEPTFNQKVLSGYQVGLNGLQAYHNHLPSSIGTCSSDRLRNLLIHMLLLSDIHVKNAKNHDVDDSFNFVNAFKSNVELTLQKIDEQFNSEPKEPKANQTKTVTFKRSVSNPKTASNVKSKKGTLASRLSMYNVPAGNFRKDAYWKKVMDMWAKKRLSVKSRYKTATYRHRPPVEKKPEEVPSKCKPKKLSSILKQSPVITSIDEDNISTLVQVQDSKEKEMAVQKERVEAAEPASTSSSAEHEGIVVKLLQLVLDNRRRREEQKDGDGEDADAKVADILECLKAGEDVEVLRRMLEAAQAKKEPPKDDQLHLQIVKSHTSLEGAPAKKRKEPTVTVTGEKNAKLICITDENSIEERTESKTEEKDTSTEKEHVVLKVVSSTRTQTDVTANKKNKCTQKANKSDTRQMKRLPKTSRCLKKLPKDYALSIIQYKLDFHKHCKQNPMYRKTTSIQPWLLMSKISDELLNTTLLGVAREIEVNDIAQQVYDSELQL